MGLSIGKWLFILAAFASFTYIGRSFVVGWLEKEEREEQQLVTNAVTASNATISAASEKALRETTQEQVVAERQSNRVLQQQLAAARAESEKLRETLAKHDLGMLLSRRPNQVIKRINNGTSDVMQQVRDVNARAREGATTETTQ